MLKKDVGRVKFYHKTGSEILPIIFETGRIRSLCYESGNEETACFGDTPYAGFLEPVPGSRADAMLELHVPPDDILAVTNEEDIEIERREVGFEEVKGYYDENGEIKSRFTAPAAIKISNDVEYQPVKDGPYPINRLKRIYVRRCNSVCSDEPKRIKKLCADTDRPFKLENVKDVRENLGLKDYAEDFPEIEIVPSEVCRIRPKLEFTDAFGKVEETEWRNLGTVFLPPGSVKPAETDKDKILATFWGEEPVEFKKGKKPAGFDEVEDLTERTVEDMITEGPS